MKVSINFQVPKVLRYAFLVLTIGGCLLLVLNLTTNLGFTSDGPFLRGFVPTYSNFKTATIALPDAQGELRVFNFSEKKVILLNFTSAWSLLTTRNLFYLLSDNMRWVLAIMALFQMYRIFRNLDHKEVFHEENVRRIRRIAICVLTYPFIALGAALQFKGILSQIPGHGLPLSPTPVLHESLAVGVLLALIIFALAEVFRIGTHLQHEQDLTI